jgi:hypothetical protein
LSHPCRRPDAPDFNQTPFVTIGYSNLMLQLYGPEIGMHARSSIGMALLLDAPVNCEADVEIDGEMPAGRG